MAVPEQAEVEDLLTPFHGALHNIVQGAWDKWMTWRDPTLDARARASIVWCYMKARAREAFENDHRVQIVDQPQTCFFLIQDRVVLRFKKGDPEGRSRNFPTQTAMSFHEPDQDLFGVPAKVEVVYTLDATETAVTSVQIVARQNSHIAWGYSLSAPTQAEVVDLPAARQKQGNGTSLLRIKGEEHQRNRADDESGKN